MISILSSEDAHITIAADTTPRILCGKGKKEMDKTRKQEREEDNNILSWF